MSDIQRILFIPDAGPHVGGGHVMRSLTLAEALGQRGGACVFMASPQVAAVLDAFAPEIPRVPADGRSAVELMDADARAFDAVVFDHYGLSQGEHLTIARGRPSMALDDLADRSLAVDMVLDSGPQRRAEDYEGLIPAGSRLLLGPAYAPVRPQFAALRAPALARRGGPVERVLVSLGLTDLDGITARVLDRVRPRLGEVALDVVLGGAAPTLTGLERLARRDSRLNVHVDTRDMAKLTAHADFAVGAAGSSVWERCTLALPSLLLVLAPNQRPAAAAFAELGAALVVDAAAPDFESAFDRAFTRLSTDAELRARLAAKSAEVCDGLGAGRVADAFLDLIAAKRRSDTPL
ncbi:UDP-2,4-diacetamido-2,4,6-trideoxy-beta-L-altropyranose hydrolase [Phenylobacterium sp.]|uniref:UDP-2,4-diacetamido-2,4, 6-trideoxy-beta-L-altropyranose hydrolase n=1 Tax=Phenylobacterium sp. TaxID=1871053 RepID=UPI002734A74D|nr:UDP-2,4-diacetamido-2,4,6-trideoxy-beta-L-altropyranose hydrolase [Phenylobacterium sp.]MDP3660553.1 UDP-2,4-diacetamido-2,4,6-trideoxy-beta-L-altropyranose hydrolase [Phenylobacterium sp.]